MYVVSTLGAYLLGQMLAGKDKVRAGERNNQSGRKLLMPLHPLTNFEKIGYYQNETKFNGVY